MLLGIGFKVILLSAVLLGLLIPLRSRLLATDGPATSGAGRYSRHPVLSMLQPLAQLLDALSFDARTEGRSARRVAKVATAAVFVAPLSAFAVLPFGSRYDFGEGSVSLVVADLPWGIVWLIGAALISIYGSTILIADAEKRAQHAIVSISYTSGAALALVALAMNFQTLNPLEIAVAQDGTFFVGSFMGPALPMLQSLQLPNWGILLQPISLALFCVCTLAIPSAYVATRGQQIEARVDGAGQFWLRTSEHLGVMLVASVVVALFGGAGAIPYLDAATIVDAIAVYYGTGLATILCMVLHMSVFFGKVLLVALLLEPLRRRLLELGFASSLSLCWRWVVPVCMANLWVTGAWIVEGWFS